MVPPEEIDKEQPATLPADFGEWDTGEAVAEQSPASSRVESYPTPRPSVKTAAAARVAVLPVAGHPSSGPARAQAYQPPQSPVEDLYGEPEAAGNHKKAAAFAVVGAVAVLLVGGTFGYMKMRPKTVVPNPAAGSQTTMTNVESPVAATPADTTAAATTAAAANTPAAAPVTATPAVPLRAQSDAMNKQLNAPSRISSDLKALTGKAAPPSADFGAGGVEGMGGGGVVFRQNAPKVKIEAAKKVSISSGVAVGLLVHKTAPVYPPLAKSAHVSGTVVVQATISKTGGVGNLRVVGGPAMLRQAALDAVKNWRFRPYMLNGEPVETDTTVSVNFALAQ
jgi:periplasmic protein TonB